MFDLSPWIDLPLVWGLLIATAVFMYVILDGFDLGCGILLPFAPSSICRKKIMNSIAPFWDGNETWMVLGAGGLLVAFPTAYAILLPAFYIPITLMLIGLVLRGVAFELSFKASEKKRVIWEYVFHAGSLLAALMQGIILGNFIQGVKVIERQFAGGALDWCNGFALLTGVALIFGYGLLGACWIHMKTTDITQKWAKACAYYSLSFVGVFMSIITLTVPFLQKRLADLWLSTPNIFYLSVFPILSIVTFFMIWQSLQKNYEYRPFFLSIFLFLLNYIGFGISLFPWIVPYQLTLWDVAAIAPSLSLTLVGIVITLPVILAYTGYVYYVFRGKSDAQKMY